MRRIIKGGADRSYGIHVARLAEMCIRDSSYELNKPMEGQVFDIIVEGPSPRDEDMWFGRTSGNKMVLFPKDDSLSIGQTVPAHIDKAQTWVCYGSIVK